MFTHSLLVAACVGLSLSVSSATALAVPERIIILRHGEKQDAFRLCKIGVERSLALRAWYLGKNAADWLFSGKQTPAAFFAITPHTLELATPAAASWQQPVTVYSVLPGEDNEAHTRARTRRPQQAARDLMTDPRWSGTTVVMVWEHDHIARKRLERQFPSEQVTLRQLLNLDRLDNVPEDWPHDNYDYFWIVDYRPGFSTPIQFQMQKQIFPAPYNALPSNDWGQPAPLPADSGCRS